jgi:predicted ester cyclase
MAYYPNPIDNDAEVRAQNMATMRRMVTAFNLGAVDLAAECVDQSLVSYSPHQPGTEQQSEEIRLQRQAFPDLTYREEVSIAEGDMVFLAWVATGTHSGQLLGTSATGVRFELHGGEIARFRNGLIFEHWDHWLKPRIETYVLFNALTPEELARLQAGGLL